LSEEALKKSKIEGKSGVAVKQQRRLLESVSKLYEDGRGGGAWMIIAYGVPSFEIFSPKTGMSRRKSQGQTGFSGGRIRA